VSIDYFLKASAVGEAVCFGCGRPDPGSLSTPPWSAIRDHLEQHAQWTPVDLAAEALRYKALTDAGIPIVLCDDCWHCGYDWTPGEAEHLHARARRFAHETEQDYLRRHRKRLRWGRIYRSDRKRGLDLLDATYRWYDIWLLNNPGSEVPFEVAR
jgi:hypothetical protein